MKRAETLLRLGYGELAVADAYKSRLLVKAFAARDKKLYSGSMLEQLEKTDLAYTVYLSAIKYLVPPDSRDIFRPFEPFKWETLLFLMEQHALTLLIEGLYRVRAWHDAAELAKESAHDFPNLNEWKDLTAERLAGLDREMRKNGDNNPAGRRVGALLRVHYPWIAQEEVERDKKALKKIKATFEASSDNALLRSSSLGGGTEGSLGVFARRDIKKGEHILFDRSIYFAANGHDELACEACGGSTLRSPIMLSCCKVRYCSVACKTEALQSYHKVLCGKDLGWLHKAYSGADSLSNDIVPLLMVKVFATAVQNNIWPFKVSCVKTMQAGYGKGCQSFFKFLDNVIAPTRILQSLGVDIFADRRFDCWAVQTLFLRIENNQHADIIGKQIKGGLNPMFTMFNHDCDPSAIWISEVFGGSSTGVRACRSIKRDEEICICYIPSPLPEAARQGLLKLHIGKLCNCVRCVKERKAVAAEQPVEPFDFTDMLTATKHAMEEYQRLGSLDNGGD